MEKGIWFFFVLNFVLNYASSRGMFIGFRIEFWRGVFVDACAFSLYMVGMLIEGGFKVVGGIV